MATGTRGPRQVERDPMKGRPSRHISRHMRYISTVMFMLSVVISTLLLIPLAATLPAPALASSGRAGQGQVEAPGEAGAPGPCDTAGAVGAVDIVGLVSFYSYDRTAPLSARLTLEDENPWYRRYELTYLSEGDTVYAAYFEPRTAAGRVPAVIGVHGMFSDAEDQFWFVADFAARRGFAVLMPSLPYHHRRSRGIQLTSGQRFVVALPETVRDNFRRAVIDMRRGLDWLAARDNVDPHRIYITGASLGGIVSMLTYKADPRFAGGVFLVSGGGFTGILAHSDTPVVRNFRLITKLGVADMDEVAKTLTMVDPAALPDLWPRPVLMLNATQDVIFPVDEVARAARTFHNSGIIWARSSHYYPVAGAQYLMADFWASLAGITLAVSMPGGTTCRETVLPPVPGDGRLWVDLALDDPAGARSARFGIHLVNRITPTLVVPRALWDVEACRSVLEEVPASIFITEGDTAADLAFAVSYIRLLGRGAGGAYVLRADDGGVIDAGTAAGEDAAAAEVAFLDPLDIEVAWFHCLAASASGLPGASVAGIAGLSFEHVRPGSLKGYFDERIRVSRLAPIPALPDDTLLDIRWADPPF